MEPVSVLRNPSPSKIVMSRQVSGPDFDSLHKMATRILSPVPLSEVLGGVVDFVSRVVQCDACFIYVLEGDAFLLRASKNPLSDIVNRKKLKLEQATTLWAASHNRPISISQNAFSDPRFKLFNQPPEDRFESFLSVPILSHGRVGGVINLQNRKSRHYDQDEVQLVSTIGLLVGAAVEIALLETKTSQLSDQLEARKLIERAKGILQRDLGISEEEAYAALQRESCKQRKPMRDLAGAIVFNDDFKRDLKADYRRDG
jgi:uroporphyrinogen-III synthase